MMVKRIIDTSFWEDATVVDKYTPEDKYFMLYLLTNPKTTAIGIYSLPKKICAFDLGYSLDTVGFLLERFQNSYGNIVYDDEDQEIAVVNSLKYTISKGGRPVEDMVARELKAVKTNKLIADVYNKMSEWWDISSRDIDKTIKELFEAELSKRNSLYLINTNAYANAYANANTESVDDSYNDSYHDSSKNGQKSKKNVKQIESDFEKLWKLYPKKERKQDALKAYKKALKDGVTNKEIQDGILNYKKKLEAEGTEHQFIAQGGTWFNQQRWNDEYVISKPKPKNNYRRGSQHQEIIPSWMKEKENSVKQQEVNTADTPAKEYDEVEMRQRLNELIGEE